MKNTFLFVLLFFGLNAYTQPLNRYFEKSDGTMNLLGQVTPERLKEDPFAGWYEENHAEYEVMGEVLSGVNLPDSITIFMGTWCGDSRREVPRFIKILESQRYDLLKLRIICLNTGFQNYKQAPEREERGQNIHRVPTFVFHDNEGTEIGRIVEEPVVTLESDLKTILEGKEYETAYPVVADLLKKFETHSVKELRKMIPKLKSVYREKAASEYELNTYGYVLWTSFDLMKAELVFELNAALFPEKTTPWRSLSRFKQNLGKQKEAVALITKGIKSADEKEELEKVKNQLLNQGD